MIPTPFLGEGQPTAGLQIRSWIRCLLQRHGQWSGLSTCAPDKKFANGKFISFLAIISLPPLNNPIPLKNKHIKPPTSYGPNDVEIPH
jgi:hypothetical protein